MEILKENLIINKLLCWTLLLQMITIALDSPLITNLEINKYQSKAETIFELLTENIFDLVIPHNKEHDKYVLVEDFNIELYHSNYDIKFKNLVLSDLLLNPINNIDLYITHSPEPNSPPPKFI